MTEHRPCARGCVSRRWHLEGCDWQQHLNRRAKLSASALKLALEAEERDGPPVPECRGCRPRYATHGVLCESCDARLVEWLSPADATFVDMADRIMSISGVAWVRRHLSDEVGALRSPAARQDWERSRSSDDDQRIDKLLDVIVQLDGAMSLAVEKAIAEFGLTPRLYDVDTAAMILRTWLPSIERDAQFAVWLWGCGPTQEWPEGRMLQGVMGTAHRVAPWRPARTRVPGIPCPHCDAPALVQFGGSVDVTCTHCWAQIPRERYDIWTRILAETA